ncbi:MULTISPECIES: ABATE domain-containing protein [unclassified Streptomyces]|jgi:hypothetical protein|uniref:ABATE domain-containing protein n=1 Tax=Streptomyces sp. NBC_00119 TaxID=2975659 RepID=A0AAU1U2U1_9ACTN|nr:MULTISPECIES: ABATE domain-containing protein [unclassified Streptomyces]MCX4641365.1 ABATE domain-containing protein [Streptomyces sp. NBC_01446]MCX5322218.1 ABATE domain-containing protein [Streptomyces sp. NBC_00120]
MVQHAPALFLADTLGLDFLNSIAAPADTEADWIEDGDGLLAWLEQAGTACLRATRNSFSLPSHNRGTTPGPSCG